MKRRYRRGLCFSCSTVCSVKKNGRPVNHSSSLWNKPKQDVCRGVDKQAYTHDDNGTPVFLPDLTRKAKS